MNQQGADRELARLAAMTERAEASLERACAAGDPQEIADAVAEFERIEETARGLGYPTALINLVNALLVQAEALASDDALDRALDLLARNERLFRDPPMRLAYLARQGKALLMKAQRTANPSVMRDAVRAERARKTLAPRGHPEHGACMFDLGVTLLHSGTIFDKPGDLDEAVAVLEAVERRPDSSTDLAAVLSALGNARLNRFLNVTRRDIVELDAALKEHRQAMEAMKSGDPNTLIFISDFGTALMHVGEKIEDRRLLDASVETQRHAADATPPRHIRKAERLNSLASSLLALHEHTGDPENLDEAIRTSRSAVAAADPAHIHRASCLYGLASGLFRRGELRRTLLDFDEATIRAREAVEITQEGHKYLPMRLAFLAATLCYLPSVSKLEKAAEDLTLATSRLRHDDPDRALIQSNHGALLDALVGFLGDSGPEARQRALEALRLTRQALDATPLRRDRDHLVRLLNFVVASATLAQLNHDPTVLDEPLRMCQTVQDPPGSDLWDTLLEVGHASALACRYELTGDTGAAMAAIEAYQRGAADMRLSAFRRLEAAHAGARLAARCDETGAGLELYALAIDLLDSAAWRGIDRRDQERLLAQYAGLPSDAAAMAIIAGRAETAVEFLERGRGVLLDRLLDDSADLARLNQIDPGRARQFEELRRALDGVIMPDPEASDFEMPLRPPEQESEADRRSALARQLDHLISGFRALPRCADLFRSPSFPALWEAIGPRSVAVVNVSALRCDALIVTPDGVMTTPLSALTKQEAEHAAEFFRAQAQETARPGLAGQVARDGLTARLAWLWDTVAEPILREIGVTDAASAGAEVRRLHWCPAGPAAFLPLHAAGHHGEATPSVLRTVIDRIESVYIPKLHALGPRRPDEAVGQETSRPPLIVSMPTTPGRPPLPSAQGEADQLLSLYPAADYLTGTAATRDAVLAEMGSHCWFHFAVHGVTDDRTPVDGGLELIDGRLTIRDLAERRLPDARFAYLSACATYQGSPAIPDEAVTVGTALCIAGCQNVVAALWPVADEHTADFARRMYGHLVTSEEGIPVLHPENSAQALRETARALRDAHPDQPERWAAFVCATSR
jgi:tetratricopeptide (TPR) repeat protein